MKCVAGSPKNAFPSLCRFIRGRSRMPPARRVPKSGRGAKKGGCVHNLRGANMTKFCFLALLCWISIPRILMMSVLLLNLPTLAVAVLQDTAFQTGTAALPFRRIWAALLLFPLLMPIFGGGAEIDGSNIQFNPETLDAVQRRPYDRALQAFRDDVSRAWTFATIENEYNLQPKTFRLYKNWSDQQPVVTAEELHRIARGLLFSFNINARLSSCNYSNGSWAQEDMLICVQLMCIELQRLVSPPTHKLPLYSCLFQGAYQTSLEDLAAPSQRAHGAVEFEVVHECNMHHACFHVCFALSSVPPFPSSLERFVLDLFYQRMKLHQSFSIQNCRLRD
jgi:hypothetical protein